LQAAAKIAAVAYEARRAYTHAAKAREEEAIAREALGLTEQLHEVARLRQQAGTGNEIDVNLARTRQLETETMVRGARLTTVEAHTELARVLGLSVAPDTLPLTASLPDPNDWAVSAEALQRIARANRLDLQIAEQSVGEAQARAKEERARFLKSLQIGFALERVERRSRGRRDWVAETIYDSLQAGQLTPPNLMPREAQGTEVIAGPTFGFELPLWDQNQAQIAKADLAVEQAVQMRDALLVDVVQDIHSRLARARTAAENAVFYRDQQLPATERNVSLSGEAYKAGRVSFLSVLEAERTYLAAKSGYLEALEHAAVATIELEQVTGRPASVLLSAQGWNETTYPTVMPTMPEVKP
jgi:cobalt-zinc-cadmium efflux system outer membrane protein